MKILLVGISTRALAQSAVAAGHEIISLDFFGDSDQPAGAEVYSLIRDLGQPPELPALARSARAFVPLVDKVVIEAGLENEPALLDLCPPEKCWGNSAAAVNGVRDLNQVRAALRGTRMCFPDIIYPGDPTPVRGHYLVKDAAHSGGMGVREWDGKTPPRGREVLESFIEGELASACFVADGRNVRLLGLSRQYAGEPGLGAPAYAWCGNIVPWGGRELEAIVLEAVAVLTESFGLTGLNGIDFILQNNIPYLLEVNPRPPASFELFERLLRLNAFQCHSDACQGKLPPAHEWIQVGKSPPGLAWGKGILYTQDDLQVGDTYSWALQDISDIPHPGEHIPAGSPVCTLFAKGKDAPECWEMLLARAASWQSGVG
jgi:uncharacterized protein